MNIKLIKGSCEYKTQIIDMLEEWTDYNSKNETNRSPWVIFKNGYDDFDYYLCDNEMEALSLENTLIKQYTPKYNIRLKDAKSYPYIKVTAEEYPRLVMTRTRQADKGKYLGPYSGVATVFSIIDTLKKTLGLPDCKHRFPRDIGKGRPCLNFHIKQCCARYKGFMRIACCKDKRFFTIFKCVHFCKI